MSVTERAVIDVVLADDHAVVRAGVRMLLEAEPDIRVIAEAEDVDATRRYVRGHHPAVLILDLNMGSESSLPDIPGLRESFPETAIVVLTMQNEPAFAREALSAGAIGYVLKQAVGAELVEAVRMAAVGKAYLNPRLGARLASSNEPSPGPPGGLTARELEVLRLIALGHTNTEIAGQLVLSVRTIESHRAHIQNKIDCSSRAELVRYALDHGLVT